MNRAVLKALAIGTLLALTSTVSCTTAVDDEVAREGEQEGETIEQGANGPDGLKSPDNPSQFSVPECTAHDESCCPPGIPVVYGTPGVEPS